MSDKYLHISISAMNHALEPHVWVQWSRDRNCAKTAQWNNAFFDPRDRDEIKTLLTKLVTEL